MLSTFLNWISQFMSKINIQHQSNLEIRGAIVKVGGASIGVDSTEGLVTFDDKMVYVPSSSTNCTPAAPNTSKVAIYQMSKTGIASVKDGPSALLATSGTSTSGGSPATSIGGSPLSVSGLRFYWRFDEGTGGTTTDSSGNGFDGTVTASWTSGVVGDGVIFSGLGTDNVAAFGTPVDPSASVSVWFNTNTLQTGGTGFLCSKLFDLSLYISTLGGTYNLLWQPVNNGTGNISWTTGDLGSGLIDGTWHHVLATYSTSGTIGKIFYDGVDLPLTLTANTGTPAIDSNAAFGVGLRVADNGYPFFGSIDEVAVFDHALVQADVDVIYHILGGSLDINLDGDGAQTISLGQNVSGGTIAADVQAKVRALSAVSPQHQSAYNNFEATFGSQYVLSSGSVGPTSSVVVTNSVDNATTLKLGATNGGTEYVGAPAGPPPTYPLPDTDNRVLAKLFTPENPIIETTSTIESSDIDNSVLGR